MPKSVQPTDTAAALDKAEAEHKAAMKVLADQVSVVIEDAAPKIKAAFETLPERERVPRLTLRNLLAALTAADDAMGRLK